jgi:subtilase family serine protease
MERILTRRVSVPPPPPQRLLEALEPRLMLSGVPVATPTFQLNHPLASSHPNSSSGPVGLVPQTIRQAYGFNAVTFGGITGDGSGQTIAIVDAYNDPNIAADLLTFDTAFNLPAATLTVVGQTGTAQLPQNATGGTNSWGIEISLDVEWTHAAAPGAAILLVEASSSSDGNLFAAINTARNYPGVSVVSLSWGSSEFSSETAYDSYLTTPSGHNGVTFVVAAGDTGAQVEYPAASPNVVAVGGTTLTTGSNGNYVSERAWGGSGGGVSAYEAQPAYQAGVVPTSITTTHRAVPDVAADADPGTGVAVLDSWDLGSSSPWIQVGGTSVSAPLWAGVLAIANQGRVLTGSATLDGPSQTLPALYALPAGNFHDITTGSNGYPALQGYDLVTGCGSPLVNLLAPALATPPTVTGVFVGSTSWTTTFTSYLTANSLGNASGYLVPAGSSQFNDLPWVTLNQISVSFSANVNISSAALTLAGVNQTSYTPTGFTYNPSTYTATWTLGTAVGPDKLIFSLNANAISDAAGNLLAGTWVNGISAYPSGTGQADTPFDFRINVVPGDIDQNGGTNATDIAWAQYAVGRPNQLFADVLGLGGVNATAISWVQLFVGDLLPTPDPITPTFTPAMVIAQTTAQTGAASPATIPSSSSTTPIAAGPKHASPGNTRTDSPSDFALDAATPDWIKAANQHHKPLGPTVHFHLVHGRPTPGPAKGI